MCINLSGELSATVQSARNAATAVAGDIDVRVIDSRSLTGGLGTMVLEAAAAARNGADADAIVAMVESMIPRTEIYGALDTLENLKKGGRIGSAKKLAILHGEAPDFDQFLDMISERYPREQIRIGKIGAVIGTHGGPGVIGMCYLRP